ncbi:PTC52 [Scenedesmus sp. PABB004]|nr:PTC52 [Scenedesmus sp. PABB004]
MADRCPHRLAPLSEGRIDAATGNLMCSYHGWEFDATGRCTSIPQIGDAKAAATACASGRTCAVTYPTQVAQGLLWVWPDAASPELARATPPALCEQWGAPGWTLLGGEWFARDLEYGVDTAFENLFDPSHIPYAHHGIMGDATRDKAQPLAIDTLADVTPRGGFQLFRDSAPYRTASRADSVNTFVPPVLNQSVQTNKEKGTALALTFFCVPVAPGRSRVTTAFFTTSRLPPLALAIAARMQWVFHLGQQQVLDSDAMLLHVQERLLHEGRDPNWRSAFFLPAGADTGIIKFRQWFDAAGPIPWPPGLAGTGLGPPKAREVVMDRYAQHTAHCKDCSAALRAAQRLQALALGLAAVAGAACVAVLTAAASGAAAAAAVATAGPAAGALGALAAAPAWAGGALGAFAALSLAAHVALRRLAARFVYVDYPRTAPRAAPAPRHAAASRLAPRAAPAAPPAARRLAVAASAAPSDDRAASRKGKQYESKSRRRGRPAWMRSPYDTPLRDGNRDRLIGLLTERAAKTLMVYLMETNANVYSWFVSFYKDNPIPRNGNWDEVSGEAFLRKLLSMPIEEAKYNTGRDELFDNVPSCGVDPRSIAQRVMDIRSQLATEFIQELQAVAEENSDLLRETLQTSLTTTVEGAALPPNAAHPELAPGDGSGGAPPAAQGAAPGAAAPGKPGGAAPDKAAPSPGADRPTSNPRKLAGRMRNLATPSRQGYHSSWRTTAQPGAAPAGDSADNAAAVAALNAALNAPLARHPGDGAAAGGGGAAAGGGGGAAAGGDGLDLAQVIASLQRSLEADIVQLTSWAPGDAPAAAAPEQPAGEGAPAEAPGAAAAPAEPAPAPGAALLAATNNIVALGGPGLTAATAGGGGGGAAAQQ